jgi:Zn-dependent protease
LATSGFSPNVEQLEELANRARRFSAAGDFQTARQHWQAILNFLPIDSPQRQGVAREIAKLDERLNPKPRTDWKKRLGPLGVVLALLLKFKTGLFVVLTKGKFLFSILAFLAVYWSLFGWRFGVGISVSILLHEMGHYLVIRWFGLKAELPMFLPGLGAYVKWQGGSQVDPGIRAYISLAGPLFGFFSGLLAYGVFLSTHQMAWLAVAQVAGWLNLINLVPVAFFDGGRAMDAIGKLQRIAILVLSLVMCYLLTENISFAFLLVGIGTAYRLWKRDFPAAGNEMAGYGFIALAFANGFLGWFCLNQEHALMSGGTF